MGSKFRFFSILAAFLLLTGSFSQAQNLRRKAQWGIWPQPVSEEVQKTTGAPSTNGVWVKQTFPGVTGEAIGLQENDIMLRINGQELPGPQALGNPENQFRDGDKIEVVVFRNGKEKKLKGNAVGKPFEEYEHSEVTYGEVAFEGGYLRSIVTRPKGVEKAPAVFFVPGFTCASYDAMPEFHPYQKLLEGFMKAGFVVYRVEKPGMGDCDGTPRCQDIDFYTEQRAFEAGYDDFLKLNYIDKENIFIAGHSMGGLQGPLLAQKYHPKGIWVYGTSHVSWHEYILNMLRFQNPRLGVDYKQHDEEMKLYTKMMYDHYIHKKSIKEIATTDQKAEMLKRDFWWDGDTQVFGRHYKFMQDLQDLKLGQVWADLDCHVLSMFGESDFEAINPDSHSEIIRIVNTFHPGKGEYVFLPETNHSFIKVGSMEENVRIKASGEMGKYVRTSFNEDVVKIVVEWMKKVMNGA